MEHCKVSCANRSGSGFGIWGIVGAIILLVIAIRFLAFLFIPLLIISGVYVMCFCCVPEGRSGGVLAFLLIMTGVAGICFISQMEERTAPKISLSLMTSFFDTYDIEPLLGEVIKQGEDGSYYVTLTDHCIGYDYSCDDTPNIKIEVKAEDDNSSKKIKAKLSVTRAGMEKTSDMPFWMQVESENFEDKVLYNGNSLNYLIDGDGLRFNESGYAAGQPMKFIIEVKNKEGSDRIVLIVTKIPVYTACARYNEQYSGRVASDDVKLCRERQMYLDKKEEEKAVKEGSDKKDEEEWKNQTSDSSGGGAGRTCSHYEAGRCWDDLEMEAYSQGQYDKIYGYYGQGYYGSDDCDAVCDDILSDAYEEGYYDGW